MTRAIETATFGSWIMLPLLIIFWMFPVPSPGPLASLMHRRVGHRALHWTLAWSLGPDVRTIVLSEITHSKFDEL